MTGVRREGNEVVVTLGSDFARGWSDARRVDQVVVEHGPLPLEEFYFALKPQSRNLAAVDYSGLIGGGDPFPAQP